MTVLPGLRYGQSCDLIYAVKNKPTDTMELKITIQNTYKGAEEPSCIKFVPV